MVDQKITVNSLELVEDISQLINDREANSLEAMSAVTVILLSILDNQVGGKRTEENCLLAKKTFHNLYLLWKKGP